MTRTIMPSCFDVSQEYREQSWLFQRSCNLSQRRSLKVNQQKESSQRNQRDQINLRKLKRPRRLRRLKRQRKLKRLKSLRRRKRSWLQWFLRRHLGGGAWQVQPPPKLLPRCPPSLPRFSSRLKWPLAKPQWVIVLPLKAGTGLTTYVLYKSNFAMKTPLKP